MTDAPPRPLLRALHGAHWASLAPAWLRFEAAARLPQVAQLRRLSAILRLARGSAFAKEHGLHSVTSLADFRARVSPGDFETHRPYVERVAAGEAAVLTAAPVRMLERTSGSTSGKGKLIPFTDALRAEFAAATGPWLFDLYRAFPHLTATRSYWSLSPVARERERTSGGLPIGFESDTEYLGPWQRRAVEATLAVPSTVARAPDMDSWRRDTLRHLLAAGDLGLFSVWSPTFLTLLFEALLAHFDELVAGLSAQRARAVRDGVQRAGRVTGEALWPRLQLISCWTDASAADFLPALRRHFPTTHVQGKGLLATEGVVSFPLHGHRDAVVALTSHFLEFVDLDAPSRAPLLAHQLRVGGAYSPLLTTGGGLFRYRLADAVRCTGHFHAAPLLRFEGRLDGTSDVAGEKLTVREVDLALAAAKVETGLAWRFALLAPVPGPPAPRYELFIESDASEESLRSTAQVLERHFLTGHHYRYCRDLGQLGPVQARRVRDGEATYLRTLTARGLKPGDIKPTHLDARHGWAEAFSANPLSPAPGAPA